MKIANIILTSKRGGAEQVFLDYGKIFAELGHETSFVVRKNVPFFSDAKELCNKVYEVNNRFGYADIFAINNIAKILQQEEVDIVVAHNSKAISLARKAIAKVKKEIAIIAVNHSINVKRSIGANIILNVNKEIFYRTVDLGQDPKASFVMHNGIDFPQEMPLLKKTKLSQKSVINIGIIGRLYWDKNFADVIKSIKIINEISTEQGLKQKFKLKIAGSGEEEDNLKKLVQDLALENQIEFLGWVANSDDFFKEIDIFCLPSLQETFGLVLLEAIKNCKPIIATKATGPSEILRNNIDALLLDIEPRSELPRKFANKIIEVTQNDDISQKMIQSSYLRALNKFSFNSLTKRLKELVGSSCK